MQSLWMLVASLLFAVPAPSRDWGMGACVKLATQHYGVAEIVFYRSLVGGIAPIGWLGIATIIGAGALAILIRPPAARFHSGDRPDRRHPHPGGPLA